MSIDSTVLPNGDASSSAPHAINTVNSAQPGAGQSGEVSGPSTLVPTDTFVVDESPVWYPSTETAMNAIPNPLDPAFIAASPHDIFTSNHNPPTIFDLQMRIIDLHTQKDELQRENGELKSALIAKENEYVSFTISCAGKYNQQLSDLMLLVGARTRMKELCSKGSEAKALAGAAASDSA